MTYCPQCGYAVREGVAICPSCGTKTLYGDTPVKEEIKEEQKEETTKKTFTETTFADVKKDDWHYNCVKYVYENNLMQGTDKGFEPESKMTRAMLITVLFRMANAEDVVAKALDEYLTQATDDDFIYFYD